MKEIQKLDEIATASDSGGPSSIMMSSYSAPKASMTNQSYVPRRQHYSRQKQTPQHSTYNSSYKQHETSSNNRHFQQRSPSSNYFTSDPESDDEPRENQKHNNSTNLKVNVEESFDDDDDNDDEDKDEDYSEYDSGHAYTADSTDADDGEFDRIIKAVSSSLSLKRSKKSEHRSGRGSATPSSNTFTPKSLTKTESNTTKIMSPQSNYKSTSHQTPRDYISPSNDSITSGGSISVNDRNSRAAIEAKREANRLIAERLRNKFVTSMNTNNDPNSEHAELSKDQFTQNKINSDHVNNNHYNSYANQGINISPKHANQDKYYKNDKSGNDTNDDDDDDDDSYPDYKIGDSDKKKDKSKENAGGSESAEDYSDDEDEGTDGYKVGGYHPVQIGEVYNQRYVIIKKLGWGHFSTVWMVKDRKAYTNEGNGIPIYAVKVQKSAEHYTEAAMDEVELLDCVSTEKKRCEALWNSSGLSGRDKDGVPIMDVVDHSRHVAILHDSFFHNGQNGRHMCMVFSMLGCNLLSVIKAYNYRGIPIPAVKKMVIGIAKGLDFLHRKCEIIHTDLKPENVLLQFPSQIAAEVVRGKGTDHNVNETNAYAEDKMDMDVDYSNISVEQLESLLRDPKIPTEERKRIRKNLKNIRQKEKRRQFNADDVDSDDGDSRFSFQQSNNYSMGSKSTADVSLSDHAMEQMMNERGNYFNTSHKYNTYTFAGTNFHSRSDCKAGENPSHVSEVMDNMFRVSRPSKSEVSAHFQISSAQVGNRQYGNESGIAEISFLIRAFTPEGELADTISEALSGIPWDRSDEGKASREWRCGLSVQRPGQKNIATIFKILQRGRKDVNDGLRKTWTQISELLGENISNREATSVNLNKDDMTSNRTLAFSLFSVKFSVLSTNVVLGFLESRLPGVMFFVYKRDEGNPPLDHLCFGPYAQSICSHPFAMRVKGNDDNPSTTKNAAASLFGFDLRMIKNYAARPVLDQDGCFSFKLSGPSCAKIASRWSARHPIHERVKSFMGLSLNATIDSMPHLTTEGLDLKQGNKKQYQQHYQEGSKSTPMRNMVNMRASTQTAITQASKQPNLKDTNVLMQSRAVVVDLGNACWTYRHFSEDIQTRQYRAPEVLIGSKYGTSADIWSLGCIAFELLTGDLLFDPRAGDNYDRDEDHLAMFQELLGKIPKKLALSGKYSRNFFDRKGNLKHIKQLKFWPVEEVLHEKYHFSIKDAQDIANFMMPLLEFDPAHRSSAMDCLRHKWLQDAM
eukprot:CAMPEP_0184868374 /NCGR_PEP_ID=MMETSP0580-20130426/30238_1 /TAXON_ID=1118495 /ORGANISM="Dactyliosolen fragilissimus" /LENGTH=1248 /DNA_ID=CAMNT_0027369225 /DNA_START=635 /DNA_END=4381 /DNA_ORIENTATION=+